MKTNNDSTSTCKKCGEPIAQFWQATGKRSQIGYYVLPPFSLPYAIKRKSTDRYIRDIPCGKHTN